MGKGGLLAGLLLVCAAGCTPSTPSTRPVRIVADQSGGAVNPSVSPVSSARPAPAGGTGTRSPVPDLSTVHVGVEEIALLDRPVAMAVRADDPALYLAEQAGRVMAIRSGHVDPVPLLDVSDRISARSWEQGLLGLAFSPDGSFVYVNYTDTNGDTRVVEYRMAGGRADPASARLVLLIPQPKPVHNGGNLVFGPDGYLFIGMGDGGVYKDRAGNGQNLGVLLGKMLRIDPRPAGGLPYGVPADNPFVGRPGARPEIWAYGLRNPWRYEFDRGTGDLWIADVGWRSREEIDVETAGSTGGRNYGWPAFEGTVAYGRPPVGTAVPPTHEYAHSNGRCAVIGGFVYRGTAIAGLTGAYVFGDLCAGTISGLALDGGKVVEERVLCKAGPMTSFGQGQDGELYVLSLSGEVSRLVDRGAGASGRSATREGPR